ncbi:MAG TPA: hypothetical protein VFA58_05280, partial [Chthoniobacterales bacterium]|nr:hypothetical protein [Chthoniobacterales bacterium]
MPARSKWLISIGILLVLAGSVYYAGTRAVDRFIRSEGFLRFISEKTAVKLGVSECGYLPVARRGLSVHSAGILARSQPPHHLTALSAVNLHAACSLENLWQRKFTIRLLKASQLQAAYGEAAAAQLQKILPAAPDLEPERETATLVNIDIRQTDIDRTDVYWGSRADDLGALKSVTSRFFPKDHGLDIFGHGGTFQQTGWPALNVDQLHLNWAEQKLIVKAASFSLGAPGNFNVGGEFNFGEHGSMQLHLSAKNAPAEPFITGYWKGKFEASLDSESDLSKQFEPGAKVSATGDLNFSHATVHDVQALKQIALVTRRPQFEKPKIDLLRFHYRYTGDRLEVSKFVAETKGLCRLEGDFSLENKNIDGNFKIGAAPDVVDQLPGAREEVFTESHGGYLWTTLRLTGPAHHPNEDLKQRLVAAAQKHFAKGILAPLFKTGKPFIEI